ncbi:glyoxal reductase [Lichtheimia corymbifera JMRC:FSU:9682]|uniref:Glyoxal reductase n=1 Tax=Lichtheimia corymbifera JMRC:FSU:9682 TaxID=1263082 RepID=A0A068RMP2_9FUNG|nr:glyoxal reductase [Lichtheimia corymbifera JMRC:FSU:9682]
MSQLRILLGERETAVNQHGIIRRRVSMNPTRTLFSRMNGLASRRLLNDGNAIPLVGFGVYNTRPGKETEQAVLWALDAGYRHIDTATIYENEKSVGDALKKTNVPRDEIFVTTKLWDTSQGYQEAKAAFEKSITALGLDYIDLYLVHSPSPGKKLRLESWKALEEIQKSGKVKSIVTMPAVNQIEISPYLARTEIEKFCKEHGILLEAFSPLTMGEKLKDDRLVAIAKKYNKTTAQILIRWSIQHGYVPLPKSVHKERIESNAQVFDFEISEEDMKQLDKFDEYFVTEWDPTRYD